ncbi:acetyl esterase/lipase [Pedobacter sp. CAN_A7]|uniref:alpha/beta hydrolase n=1 Tax=Pedobacter sp. CAN_A7 TaxID=2787722 RepID=UPI0018CB61D3
MKNILILALLLFANLAYSQQQVIKLYPGKAPGSENWNWKEAVENYNPKSPHIYNVVEPSLTVFKPSGTQKSETAVIVAPGGGFQMLAFEKEGTAVAKWLAEKGVTVFVLKYRVNRTKGTQPGEELSKLLSATPPGSPVAFGEVVEFAMNDGLEAVKYVREHAADYGIDPGKIGFMGFSAGGTVTMSVAMTSKGVNQPNFIAPIYTYLTAAIGNQVPKEKMPAFLAAASNDGLGLAPHTIEIYSKWLAAGQEVELHMYEKGDHGFGMSKQGLPADTWIDRFGDWLHARGLLTPAK